jgi:hypothetical protein
MAVLYRRVTMVYDRHNRTSEIDSEIANRQYRWIQQLCVQFGDGGRSNLLTRMVSKCIVLERTMDRQQRDVNPNTTIRNT